MGNCIQWESLFQDERVNAAIKTNGNVFLSVTAYGIIWWVMILGYVTVLRMGFRPVGSPNFQAPDLGGLLAVVTLTKRVFLNQNCISQ